MAMIALLAACFTVGITAARTFAFTKRIVNCKELVDDQTDEFASSMVDAMFDWRKKARDPASGAKISVSANPGGTVYNAMVSAATTAAKEVCGIGAQLFVSKAHVPDLFRNVYVIARSVTGRELVNKIVKMGASLERYRYCPNAMKLLKPEKGQVKIIDRNLIFQKRENGLAFVVRVVDDHDGQNRYVAIIFEGDKGQEIKEFVGPMDKLAV